MMMFVTHLKRKNTKGSKIKVWIGVTTLYENKKYQKNYEKAIHILHYFIYSNPISFKEF